MNNKRLFEEAINEKYLEHVSNHCSNPIIVKYRRERLYKAYDKAHNNPQEYRKNIETLFLQFKVNLKNIKLTSEDINQILAVFLAKVSNVKLTNNQIAFINELQSN